MTIPVNRDLSNCEIARKVFRGFNGIRTRGLCVRAAVFYQNMGTINAGGPGKGGKVCVTGGSCSVLGTRSSRSGRATPDR